MKQRKVFTQKVVELTPAQWAVVEWLHRHPAIYVTENDGYLRFSCSWHDESARRHMIATTEKLAPYLGELDAREQSKPVDLRGGGTPRLCTQTWRALKRRGVIEARRYEKRSGGVRYRFQLARSITVADVLATEITL